MSVASALGPRARDFASRWGALTALAVGLGIYLVFNVHAATARGMWFDEYATLYFADPARPPAAFLSDTQPPLYYMLVRAAQTIGLDPQASLWTVNLAASGVYCALAWLFLRRAGRPLFALAAIGAILAGPAALTFALEGRNYAMAQFACVAFTAGALARLDVGARRGDLAAFALLAGVCAASHLYGALYAGALSAAMAIIGVTRHDRALALFGVVCGAAASIVVAVWLAIAAPVLFGGKSLVSWIPNTASYTLSQFWFLNKMTSGVGANAALLVAGIALSAARRPARPYAALLALSAALFAALPVLASLKTPMLAGRYLAIAAPSLILQTAFLAWRALDASGVPAPTRDRPQRDGPERDGPEHDGPERAGPGRLGAWALGLYLAIAAASAPGVAWRMTREQRDPYDAAGARAALGDCAAARVRIWIPDLPAVGGVDQQTLYAASYRRALARPDARLDESRGPIADVADYPCPLVAWGEHMAQFSALRDDEAQLLAALRLTNKRHAPLRIVRHQVGFLLVRASPP